MRAAWLLPVALLASSAQQNATWTEPVTPFAIADDLYYVGTAGLSSFLLTSPEGHVLIDATLAENVPLLLENIRSLGFDPHDVRLLLASHAHFDHVAGMASMREATGAELLMSEADAPFAREGRDFGLDTEGYPPVSPDRTLRDLETVRVGDLELTAHVTAGHTPGCTSWSGTVHVEGQPATFTSICSLSVLDYRLVGPEAIYPGQGRDFCRSVAQLRALAPDLFLAAHPGFFRLPAKRAALEAGDRRAFVDPEGYAVFLDRAEAAIEKALAAQGHVGGCAALLR